MSLWFMRDNHTFLRLPDDEDVAIAAIKAEWEGVEGVYADGTRGVQTTRYGSLFARSDILKQWFRRSGHDSFCHAGSDWGDFEPRARQLIRHYLKALEELGCLLI